MSNRTTLRRLEQLAGRRRPAGRGEWTAAGAVHQKPEHVLAVLRELRDIGALGDVLKDEGLEADAVALLGMIDAGELNAAELAEWWNHETAPN